MVYFGQVTVSLFDFTRIEALLHVESARHGHIESRPRVPVTVLHLCVEADQRISVIHPEEVEHEEEELQAQLPRRHLVVTLVLFRAKEFDHELVNAEACAEKLEHK